MRRLTDPQRDYRRSDEGAAESPQQIAAGGRSRHALRQQVKQGFVHDVLLV
jgi:hypothetical protein